MKLLALIKYRWDLAMGFLTYINFALLSITASDNIQKGLKTFFKLDVSIITISICMILLSIFLILFTGFLLDKYMKYGYSMASISNQRNPEFIELIKNITWIKNKLKKAKL